MPIYQSLGRHGSCELRRATRYTSFRRSTRSFERCVLMTTDPGDLVLDPTCGSGTTAYVAEQWGRRWITIDTSRVALALARARIMGARYPVLPPRRLARGAASRKPRSRGRRRRRQPTHGNIRHGFVYERVPHITLKSIANNAEIDVIWEQVAGDARAAARDSSTQALKADVGGVGDSARGRARNWPDGGEAGSTPTGGKRAHRAAEGDRRLDRRQGRVRVPLRQALRGQEEGPRRRPVHGREPVAAPRRSASTRTTS